MSHGRWILRISSVLILVLSQRLAFGETASGLKSPDLRDKIGQLFIFGVRGEKLDARQQKLLQDLRPGGVVLFRRNFSSLTGLRDFTFEIRGLFQINPFIAIDQEGGLVTRIDTNPKLPSARWWGFRANSSLSEQLGFELGRIMLSYGINMNLAPVLDISEPKSFLRSRSYSSNSKTVAELGPSVARGLARAGVLPTAKHFPGLGRISEDPHRDRVEISTSLHELIETDLVPFQKFSQIEPSAMMLSHSVYPGLDSSRTPATYSRKIVSTLLRHDLNYKGLVITDDLLMAGANSGESFSQRVVKALAAGSDMILIAWSEAKQREAVRAVELALKSGQISQKFLDEKFKRIQLAKLKLSAQANTRKPATDPELQLQKIIKQASLEKVRLQRAGVKLRAAHSAKLRHPESLPPSGALEPSDAR